MFEWLKKNGASRWSVYVVQNGHQQLALADSNHGGAAPALAALARLFERHGDPDAAYRVCLVFNPTRRVVWIEARSFSGGRPNAALVDELLKADSRFSTHVGKSVSDLRFVDPATGRPIDQDRLFARLWPASV